MRGKLSPNEPLGGASAREDASFEEVDRCARVHFLGAGGISMSTLARMARDRGKIVTGYDRTPSATTEALSREGIPVYSELDEAHLRPDMALVYSAAIGEDNLELAAARERGLPVIGRAGYLGGLMRAYRTRVGVCGTHGKSTVTAMLTMIFLAAGLDPSVACGAEIPALGSAYRAGGRDLFLYEACEYKDAFCSFSPTLDVILNIDLDHVDYFHSIEQTIASFHKSALPAEVVIANFDDENTRRAVENLPGRVVPVGIDAPDALYRAENIGCEAGGSRFTLTRGGRALCEIALRVPGRHNVLDALCAAAAASDLGCSPGDIARGLLEFTGARRRFERRGWVGGALLYDDYAHHPTEVAATLQAAREVVLAEARCPEEEGGSGESSVKTGETAASYEGSREIGKPLARQEREGGTPARANGEAGTDERASEESPENRGGGGAHAAKIGEDKGDSEGEAGGRVICVFQPHTYSRTAALLDDFARELSAADIVILAPIFAAREASTGEISSRDLAARIPGALCGDSFEEIAALVRARARPGDLILTMGAGDIRRVGEILLRGDT